MPIPVLRSLLACVLVLIVTPCLFADPSSVEWMRLYGTSANDIAWAVRAADDGGVYIGGQTDDPLSPNFSAGFLARYSPAGNQLWIRQLDSTGFDMVNGIATDAFGHVYVVGSTGGDLGGGLGISSDIFVRKYNSGGGLLWTRQIDSGESDSGTGIDVSSTGDIYVAGSVLGSAFGGNAGAADAILAKFNADGDRLWVQRQGTAGFDNALDVSVDGLGAVYVGGVSQGALGGANVGERDMYLSKYDSNGNRNWTRQSGTSGEDWNRGVAVDGQGNVFFAGYTESGSIGNIDGVLGKYDSNGNLLWRQDIGTSEADWIYGVSVDSVGNALVGGTTRGDIGGGVVAGDGSDLFARKYDGSGNLKWTSQIISPSIDFARAITTDGFGAVYVAGQSEGYLDGVYSGQQDAILVKLHDSTFVPEPTADLLVVLGGAIVFCLSRAPRHGGRPKPCYPQWPR